MPVKSGTLLHIQDAYKDTFREVMKCIIASDYDPTKVYVLSGCENTGTGSNYVISSGYVFIASEVYRVPATSFTSPAGQTAVIQYSSTNVNGTNYDPVQFTDGSTLNVHYENIMEIISGVAGSAISDYVNLLRINQHEHIAITPITNVTTIATTTGLNVTLNKYRQVSYECAIQTTNSLISIVTSLFTTPLKARPSATLRFAGIVDCPVDNVTYPCMVNLYANGNVQFLLQGYPYTTWRNGTKFYFNATYFIH
jgi:hypothetical protein